MPSEPSRPAWPSGWLHRLNEWQMALLVVGCGLLLYVPMAGTYGLWDPWETHYSEVARQMTKRGDYISLWWPGSPRDLEVFWSKPVLSFWLMSIGMHLAGVGSPGGAPDEMAIGTRAEWAVRTPFCLMGVLGILAVYLVTARFVSRRAGLLSAAVVATSPMYSLVARQAMTDMAFVGPMAMALALGAMALFDDADQVLPRRGGRRRFTSWPHHWLFYFAIGLFAVVTLPQLIVNSVELKIEIPWGTGTLRMYGAVAMIPYYVGFAAFIVLAAQTRYKAPLYLYIAAILCGLSVLAKGLAGLGLPLIVFVAYLGFTWNWRRLRRAHLIYGVIVSLVACAVVAVPWHHAMIIRHGWAFWNELFGDNHWRRMVLGRHGDRGTFEYFLHQLGYAVWPWVALAPAALVWAVTRRRPPSPTPAETRAQGIVWLGAIWFVSAYALVSMSMTKFHHYVLPAVPGLAICIGCFLDHLLGRATRARVDGAAGAGADAGGSAGAGARAWVLSRVAALVVILGLPLLALVTADLINAKSASQRFLWLFSYDYIHSPRGRPWPDSLDFTGGLTAFAVMFGLGLLAFPVERLRRWAVVAFAVTGVASTYFLLDHFMPSVAPFWSQKNVVAAYYRARRSPDEKLIAFQMYWRGETFYTKNEIYEGPPAERTVFDQDGADEKLREYLLRHRGRRLFFLLEKGQRGRVEGLLPPETRPTFRVIDEGNNKFILGQVDL